MYVLKKTTKAELKRVQTTIKKELASEKIIQEIYEYIFNAEGKKTRALLCLLASKSQDKKSKNRVNLASIIELLHTATLVHDDVVDGASERRGRSSAHLEFGNAATILSGDFCLARAMLLASEEGGGRAAQELARAVTEMAEGEVMQLRWAGDLTCDVQTYLQWIERKSAALISWCVAAAAWSNDDVVLAEALAAFGRGVGIAFQITDDVLDYRSGTGKKAGTDLRQRKVTLPLLMAMERDGDIRAVLEKGEPDDATLDILMSRIEHTGALEDALQNARNLVEAASARLKVLPTGDGRDALIVLGRYLVERVS